MQTADIALLALIGLTLFGVLGAWTVALFRRRHQTGSPRPQLGGEYARVVQQYGSESQARRELRTRSRRVRRLNIRLLTPEQCARFGSAWCSVQRRFVDDPEGAMVEANGLVKDVMRLRGYPIGDFHQRLLDLSAEHARVLDHYRAARIFALANAMGKATTEDLREALVHYRALFEDLLQTQGPRTALSTSRA